MAGNGSAPSEPHGPPAALKPAGCSQSTEAGPQWVSPAPSLHLLHSTLGGADFAQGPTFPFSLGLQSWRSSLSFGFPVLVQPSLICISAFPSLVQAGGVGWGESSFPEWLMPSPHLLQPIPPPTSPSHFTEQGRAASGNSADIHLLPLVILPYLFPIPSAQRQQEALAQAVLCFSSPPLHISPA